MHTHVEHTGDKEGTLYEELLSEAAARRARSAVTLVTLADPRCSRPAVRQRRPSSQSGAAVAGGSGLTYSTLAVERIRSRRRLHRDAARTHAAEQVPIFNRPTCAIAPSASLGCPRALSLVVRLSSLHRALRRPRRTTIGAAATTLHGCAGSGGGTPAGDSRPEASPR